LSPFSDELPSPLSSKKHAKLKKPPIKRKNAENMEESELSEVENESSEENEFWKEASKKYGRFVHSAGVIYTCSG